MHKLFRVCLCYSLWLSPKVQKWKKVFFSVAKATLHSQMSVRSSVSHRNPSTAWNHHPSSFSLQHSSFFSHPSFISRLLSFSACFRKLRCFITIVRHYLFITLSEDLFRYKLEESFIETIKAKCKLPFWELSRGDCFHNFCKFYLCLLFCLVPGHLCSGARFIKGDKYANFAHFSFTLEHFTSNLVYPYHECAMQCCSLLKIEFQTPLFYICMKIKVK